MIVVFDNIALQSLFQNRTAITMESKARKWDRRRVFNWMRKTIFAPYSSHRNYRQDCKDACEVKLGAVHRAAALSPSLPAPSGREQLKLVERDLFSLAHASVPPLERLWSIRGPGCFSSLFSPSLFRPRKIRDRAENSSARFEFREIKIRERIVFPREIVVTAGSLRFSAWKRGSPRA